MVVPSPKPVTPSEQTILTIIKVCACMVATDRRCGRIIGRSTTKVSTTSTLNVEARRFEKLVVERCMVVRTMRPSWPLLKGMERYHRSSGYAAAQHNALSPLALSASIRLSERAGQTPSRSLSGGVHRPIGRQANSGWLQAARKFPRDPNEAEKLRRTIIDAIVDG